MREASQVLVLDWGIGGLSVYREMKLRDPLVSCVYFSDSGFTPYGKVPSEQLASRVAGIILKVQEKYGVSHAIIACNAASTVLPLIARELSNHGCAVPVSGVIEAGVQLVEESAAKCVGVIGGQRTIDSKIFSERLQKGGREVIERVAQPLSALIEAGILTGPKLRAELTEILAPLKGIDALLLACTHYPAVEGEIQMILPSVALFDPAKRAAEQLCAQLATGKRGDEDLFLTSGSAENSTVAAQAAFGVKANFKVCPAELKA